MLGPGGRHVAKHMFRTCVLTSTVSFATYRATLANQLCCGVRNPRQPVAYCAKLWYKPDGALQDATAPVYVSA